MKYWLFFLGCLLTGLVSAQETRTTADGREIIVHPDGTWRYASADTPGPGTEDPRTLVLRLTESARAEAERLEREYRDAVRARALAEADYTTAKTDPTGARSVQERAREAFDRAEDLEAVTLERFESARKTLADYEKARTYSDKKLIKYLRKAGYTPGEATAGVTPPAKRPAEDDDKAEKKRRKALAKAEKREAKLLEQQRKRDAERRPDPSDDDEGMAANDKAARKAAKREAKRLKKLRKEEAELATTGTAPPRRPDAAEPINGISPPGPPTTVVPAIRATRPEDYAQYSPAEDVLLNPPGNSCEIVFDGEDQFSGKYRKETAPRLLFAYTPPQLRAYITDRDYVTAYGSIIRIGGGLQILVLELYVAAENADRAFGNIPRNGQLNIKTLAGDNILLLNNKLARGRWDAKAGHTYYRGQYILDKQYEQQLINSEVDQIRMVWETGYDDIPVYELDFFRDQFRCLNEG